MACRVLTKVFKARSTLKDPLIIISKQCRFQSSVASSPALVDTRAAQGNTFAQPRTLSAPPLARLSTASILRSLLLSTFFTSPLLFRLGFAVFHKVANTQSAWLNPDQNPLLRTTIYPLVYKQFCAGRSKAEITQTSAEIRGLGFSGVVLCYGREVQIESDKFVGYDEIKGATMAVEIDQWAKGNLETLDMVEKGDWLGIK